MKLVFAPGDAVRHANAFHQGSTTYGTKPFACDWPGCYRKEGFSTKNDLTRPKKLARHGDEEILLPPRSLREEGGNMDQGGQLQAEAPEESTRR